MVKDHIGNHSRVTLCIISPTAVCMVGHCLDPRLVADEHFTTGLCPDFFTVGGQM